MRALRSLLRSKKTCGSCLFELKAGLRSLRNDLPHNSYMAFATSDWHEFSAEQLEASAARGCPTCQGLVAALKEYGATFSTGSWCPQGDQGGGHWPTLRLDSPQQQFELCVTSSEVVLQGESSLHPAACKRQKLVGNTGDKAALAQGANWLINCRSNHAQCKVRDQDFVPTRLLLISPDSPETIRLVENPPLATVYAALSHRWSAETQTVRLETSNLPLRKQDGIPLTQFPLMMQEALSTLRQLGIYHVWIDCMCIIQDDKDDWRREAATMASIYANAELTIAATCSSSGGQGLFRDRGKLPFAAIDIGRIDGQPVFLRRALPHFTWQDIEGDWFAHDSLRDPEMEWPLLARGWVYQEHLLSRRILHFTRQELLWECHEATRCECEWHDFDSSGGKDAPYTCKRSVISKPWWQIVREYSKRDLTFPSDRLAALAGIAKTFAKSNNVPESKYLCGMWPDSLPEIFFWNVIEPPSGPRLDIGLPSWSWASVQGNVSCYTSSIEQVDFLSYAAIHHGDACMGDTGDATITLSGRVAEGVIYHGQQWLDVVEQASIRLEDDSTLLPGKDMPHVFGLSVGKSFATFHADYKLDLVGEGFIPSGSQILCMPFGRITSTSHDPDTGITDEKMCACCLLLRCVDEDEQRYERIGVCMATEADNYLDLTMLEGIVNVRELTLV